MKSKKLLIMLFFGMVLLMPLMAVPDQLTNAADAVLELFTSDLVKAVLTIALMTIAIGAIKNRDNEQMKNKLITWLVAVGLLTAASYITDWFWQAAGGAFLQPEIITVIPV